MFDKILVAVDDNEVSQRAFQAAITLGKLMSARLLLVHVQSPVEMSFPNRVFPYESTYPGATAEAFGMQLEQWEETEERGHQLLRSLADAATASGVHADVSQPLGNPGQTLCELARTWGASLIVVGRRGHTGLEEALAGSVSNYVMHHAHCPVLTVQGKTPA